ncbi:PRC-barrel domain-containing protein [Sulfitobacter sp. LCG007]
MKNLLLTTAMVLSGATVAVAQDNTGSVFTTETAEHAVRASDFIGMRVYSSEQGATNEAYEGVQADWEDIGEINDVILTREGDVQSVLVDIGGFLGIGERQVAINMDAVKFVSDDATDADDFFLVLQSDRATLEGAPEYTWTDDDAMDADTAATDTQVTENQATTEPMADKPVDPAMADTSAVTDGTSADGEPMLAENTTSASEQYQPATEDRITSENLTGARVYDSNDEWIGEVSMFLLGEEGKGDMAVVDVGGFLGLGEKPVALDIGELDIMQENDGDDLRVYVGLTKEELEALPTYEK